MNDEFVALQKAKMHILWRLSDPEQCILASADDLAKAYSTLVNVQWQLSQMPPVPVFVVPESKLNG